MGKAPAFQFYPMDWMRDLEEHPLEIEGAWIRIICKLWWSEDRGSLSKTYEQWSRILRVSIEETKRIISYLSDEKICDISVTDNGKVTVMSRRMMREERERTQAALRQRRKRERDANHADVTIASSSSSSSSSSKKNKNTLAGNDKKIIFNYQTQKWENLNGMVETWQDRFPAIDIKLELNKMASWLEANPKNKKSNYQRFIVNWLTKAQDKAPGKGGKELW